MALLRSASQMRTSLSAKNQLFDSLLAHLPSQQASGLAVTISAVHVKCYSVKRRTPRRDVIYDFSPSAYQLDTRLSLSTSLLCDRCDIMFMCHVHSTKKSNARGELDSPGGRVPRPPAAPPPSQTSAYRGSGSYRGRTLARDRETATRDPQDPQEGPRRRCRVTRQCIGAEQ